MVLMLLKNEALTTGVAGEIMTVFEKRGYRIKSARTIEADIDFWKQHYAIWRNRDFYQSLVTDLSKTPLILAIDWLPPAGCELDQAILMARSMLGNSDPTYNDMSTIRGRYASSRRFNFCHISSSVKEYEYEVALSFPQTSTVSTTPKMSETSKMSDVVMCGQALQSTSLDDKQLCMACRGQLGTDRVSLCGQHQFHARCIGDNETECPCAHH